MRHATATVQRCDGGIMVRRVSQRERLRRVARRRRPPEQPPTKARRALTGLTTAILAGISAVIVSLITGLGSTAQKIVTDALFDEHGKGNVTSSASPSAKPSAAIKVAVTLEDTAGPVASEHRVTTSQDKAVLLRRPTSESFERLYRKLHPTSVAGNSYKVIVTNVSSSPVRVVDVVPVITRRSKAINTTIIFPLGGMGATTIPVDLELNKRYPKFTQHGKPYFSGKSQILAPGKGFVMVVLATLPTTEYVEYHLRVDYVDSGGDKHSLNVADPEELVGTFRLSGILDATKYIDYWGLDESKTDERVYKLYTPEERRAEKDSGRGSVPR
ncbi:hypothetical protein ACIRH0_00490 [Streptomyces sp. NPDC093675]|uniref:hypothetical protein n=1 Tax=Streptomyces sp. NPDC093675 TaxID=3366049 RepID=UPI0037FF4884